MNLNKMYFFKINIAPTPVKTIEVFLTKFLLNI